MGDKIPKETLCLSGWADTSCSGAQSEEKRPKKRPRGSLLGAGVRVVRAVSFPGLAAWDRRPLLTRK